MNRRERVESVGTVSKLGRVVGPGGVHEEPVACVGGTRHKLVLVGAAKALNGRAASSRKRCFSPQSARYDFRIFPLHLEMIEQEFKTVRQHLLTPLEGDPSFRYGRPTPARHHGGGTHRH